MCIRDRLTPLGAYADVILYHHLPYDRFTDQDPYVKFLAGAVHVADRVDVLLLERPQADVVEVERLLAASRPGAFSPEAVALFFEAQRRFDVLARLRSGVKQPDRSHIVDDPDGTGSASSFLDMLVPVSYTHLSERPKSKTSCACSRRLTTKT